MPHTVVSAFDAQLFVATIDDRLDDDGFIRPGLGDAGDRTWGVELSGALAGPGGGRQGGTRCARVADSSSSRALRA